MKSFVTAVEDIEAEDARDEKVAALVTEWQPKIDALVEKGFSEENARAKVTAEAEDEVDYGTPVEFDLDGRIMRAYPPADGQLALLLASLGRGQSKEGRFAAILNIMFDSLNEDDKDHLEARMAVRDKARRIPMKQIEAIFEYLVEEWFR